MKSCKLGSGFVLGDSLDCNSFYYPLNHNIRWEMSWGNSMLSPIIINKVASKEFDTIKIPVTWDEHILYDKENDKYYIEDWFLDRVKSVIKSVLDTGKYCIINTQHDSDWICNVNIDIKDRLSKYRTLWKLIATELKDFDSSKLIYENMNEYGFFIQNEDNETNNIINNNNINYYNSLTSDFIDIVRNIDGNNDRTLIVDGVFSDLISTYNALTDYDTKLKDIITSNENILLGIHIYDPRPYTVIDNADSEMKYSDDYYTNLLNTTSETIQSYINKIKDEFNIDIYISEMGCNRLGKSDNRVKDWLSMIYSCCKNTNIGVAMWDDGKYEKEVIDRESMDELIPGVYDIIHNYCLLLES